MAVQTILDQRQASYFISKEKLYPYLARKWPRDRKDKDYTIHVSLPAVKPRVVTLHDNSMSMTDGQYGDLKSSRR